MSKRKNKNNRAAVDHNAKSGGAAAEAFSFGDPVPVLDRRELLDYVECVQMDRWYEPPVSFDGLARTYRAAVHHSSPIAVKRDILSSTYIPHRLLSQQAFARFVQDYLVFGNAYLESAPTGSAVFSHWSQHWRSTHAVAWTSTPTGLCSMA